MAEQIADLFEPPGLAPPAGNQRRCAGVPEVMPTHVSRDARLLEVFVEAVQLTAIASAAAWSRECESQRVVRRVGGPQREPSSHDVDRLGDQGDAAELVALR